MSDESKNVRDGEEDEVQDENKTKTKKGLEERQAEWLRVIESNRPRRQTEKELAEERRILLEKERKYDDDFRLILMELKRGKARAMQGECSRGAGTSQSSSYPLPTRVNGISEVDDGSKNRKRTIGRVGETAPTATVPEVEAIAGPCGSSSSRVSQEPSAKRRASEAEQSEDAPLSTPDSTRSSSSSSEKEAYEVTVVEEQQQPSTSMAAPVRRMRTKLPPIFKKATKKEDKTAFSSPKKSRREVFISDDEEPSTSGPSASVPVAPVPPANNVDDVTVANANAQTDDLRGYLEGIVREALSIHSDIPLDPTRGGVPLEDVFPVVLSISHLILCAWCNRQNVVVNKVCSAFVGFNETIPGRQDSGDSLDEEQSEETIAFMQRARSPLAILRRRLGITARRFARMALSMSSFASLSNDAKFLLLKEGIAEMLCLYGFCLSTEFQELAGITKKNKYLQFIRFFEILRGNEMAVKLLLIVVLVTPRDGLEKTGDKEFVEHLYSTLLNLFRRYVDLTFGVHAEKLLERLSGVLELLKEVAGTSLLLFLGGADSDATEHVPNHFFKKE